MPAEPENTDALEKYLFDADELDHDTEVDMGPAVLPSKKPAEGNRQDSSQVVLRIPQKRWLEQIALEQSTAKRPKMSE